MELCIFFSFALFCYYIVTVHIFFFIIFELVLLTYYFYFQFFMWLDGCLLFVQPPITILIVTSALLVKPPLNSGFLF